MSLAARQALVHGGHIFADTNAWPHALTDLLDESKTSTELIEGLTYIVGKGYHFQLTAVNTDHATVDGPHGHNGGYAVDGWPLTGPTQGAWLDAGDAVFQRFLGDLSAYRGEAGQTFQIGLAGSAKSSANFAAAAQHGVYAFDDDDQDHIHWGFEPIGAGW